MRKILTSILVTLLIMFSTTICYAETTNDFNTLGFRVNVPKNKAWNINFTDELNKDTVNLNTIKVLDKNGQPYGVDVNLAPGNKVIVISPKTDYEYGSSYTLIVTREVKSIYNKNIDKALKLDFTIVEKAKTNNSFKITLDAGQGGVDDGVIGKSGYKEKDLNLSVVLKVGKLLENKGINVVYTRKDDNISWAKNDVIPRFKIANDEKADLYLSIHGNYVDNSLTSTGTEAYYKSGDDKSSKISNMLLQNINSNTGFVNRGSNSTGALEINGLNMPAVKLVLGFLNNPDEENKLKDSTYQDKFAAAICDSVLKYKEQYAGEPTVSSINQSSLIFTAVQGQNYVPTSSVNASMSDGTTKMINVKWENTSINTAVTGTYSIKGTLDGYTYPAYATVLVVSKADGKPTVVLDAGHGDRDSGAVGSKSMEKNLTLAITLKTGAILKANGVNVVYTRSDDNINYQGEGDDLVKRVNISNAVKPNYFLSIHINSASPEAKGTETYWFSDGSQAAYNLALQVQNELSAKNNLLNRGVKTANFYVIKYTDAPAALTEVAFVSNKEEEDKLITDEFQQKCAEGIANGILKALGILK